jgi:hypothetical protein
MASADTPTVQEFHRIMVEDRTRHGSPISGVGDNINRTGVPPDWLWWRVAGIAVTARRGALAEPGVRCDDSASLLNDQVVPARPARGFLDILMGDTILRMVRGNTSRGNLDRGGPVHSHLNLTSFDGDRASVIGTQNRRPGHTSEQCSPSRRLMHRRKPLAAGLSSSRWLPSSVRCGSS